MKKFTKIEFVRTAGSINWSRIFHKKTYGVMWETSSDRGCCSPRLFIPKSPSFNLRLQFGRPLPLFYSSDFLRSVPMSFHSNAPRAATQRQPPCASTFYHANQIMTDWVTQPRLLLNELERKTLEMRDPLSLQSRCFGRVSPEHVNEIIGFAFFAIPDDAVFCRDGIPRVLSSTTTKRVQSHPLIIPKTGQD